MMIERKGQLFATRDYPNEKTLRELEGGKSKSCMCLITSDRARKRTVDAGTRTGGEERAQRGFSF